MSNNQSNKDIIHIWEQAVKGKITIKQLFNELKTNHPPFISATFTRECVNTCKHCVYPKANCMDKKLTDINRIDKIINAAYSMGYRDFVHVGRILEADHLTILKKYYDKGMTMNLIDNGYGARLVPKIKEMGLRFVGGVDISVDGNKKVHDFQRNKGAYDRAIEGIIKFPEVAGHVSVTGTASSLNYDTLVRSLYELYKKYPHIKKLQITTTSPANHHDRRMNLTPSEMKKLFSEIIKYSSKKNFPLSAAIYRNEDIKTIISELKAFGKPEKKYINIFWKINNIELSYFPMSIVPAEEIAIDANGRHVLPFGLDHHLSERPEKWEMNDDIVLTDPDRSYEMLVEKYYKTIGKKVFEREKKIFNNT